MQNRETAYLKSIIKHCQNIEKIHTEYEYSHEKYYKSPGYQYSISFCVEQIGELVVKFRNDGFSENYKNIPWNKIAGMRNRIAHGYDSIDLDMVYHISLNDIPQLLKDCKEILKEKDELI